MYGEYLSVFMSDSSYSDMSVLNWTQPSRRHDGWSAKQAYSKLAFQDTFKYKI